MSTPETPPSAGGDEPGRGLSGIQRAGVVLGALAVLLVVFVILRGNDDNGDPSSSSAPETTATQGSTTTGADSTASGSTSTSTSTSTSAPTTGSTSTATTPPEPAVETVRVVNAQPAGGIKTISYTKGDQIRLKVESDTADEIHVHGYDLKKDVTAGGSVEFDFKATIEGRFEVELENAGTQIATLQVNPS
jgi:hypothetical protein